jgi:hypothetical protein
MAGQGSARVILNEIDLSQVSSQQQLPQGVPAAVVGPAQKGPAFVPKTFANIQQFNSTFGSVNNTTKDGNGNLNGPLGINEWMKNSQAGTYVRTLGIGDGTDAAVGSGFNLSERQFDEEDGVIQDNKYALTSSTNTGLSSSRTHVIGTFLKDAETNSDLYEADITTSGTLFGFSPAINFSDTNYVSANTFDKISIVLSNAITEVGAVTLDIHFVNDAMLNGNAPNNTIYIAAVSEGSFNGQEIAAGFVDMVETVGSGEPSQGFGFNLAGIPAVKCGTIDFDLKNSLGASLYAPAGDNIFDEVSIYTSKPGAVSSDFSMIQTSSEDTIHIYDSTGVKVTEINVSTNSDRVSSVPSSGPVGLGLLMTAQGVALSLDVSDIYNSASYNSFTASTITTSEFNGVSKSFGTGVNDLGGYEIGKLGDDNDFKLYLTGFDNPEESNVYDLSLDPKSSKYFAKVLNTDPEKFLERGHLLYSYVEADLSVYNPDSSDLLRVDDTTQLGSKVCFVKRLNNTLLTDWTNRFTNAKTPWITSQIFDANDVDTLSNVSNATKLFRLHALDDGAYANDKYRLLVSDIISGDDTNWSTFTLSLERFDSDPILGEKLLVWKNANLDRDSSNFIGRLIGDMHTYWDFSVDHNKQTLITEGEFEVKNTFVRIEMSEDVLNGDIPKNTIPFGFYSVGEINFDSSDLAESGPQMLSTATVNNISSLRMMPMPFVKTISRKVSSSDVEVSTQLPWGMKFGKKNHPDADLGELLDKEFNDSLTFFTKFYPQSALKSENESNVLGGNYFTMQKIEADIVDSNISWESASYKRDRILTKTRFINPSDATTKNMKFMKFRLPFFGGFDGNNIFSRSSAKMTDTACIRELASDSKTGPTIEAYKKAVDTLSDRSAADIQLLAIPGIRCRTVTDYALTACENRFDAMYIMDIEEYDENSLVICSHNKTKPHVRNTVSMFSQRRLDSSFGAAYFPNVIMNKPNSKTMIEVPPTVSMLGAISLNDSLKDPWFAPAGLTRGKVSGSRTSVQMNLDVLNDLYDADINPLYVPAGRTNEVYAFGQKTLMQDSSALDRINVRRLLINLRRQVKDIATSLLFEPNRASTLQRFNELVEPILLNVKKREGVERYKVQIDTTTTTQNDIENNTIRGKIYLQPTKAVEFISLDFVVSNSID